MRSTAVLFLAAGCVPVLETPGGNVPEGCEDWAWVAPENDWPAVEPPCLIGEGFYEGEVVPDFRMPDQHGKTVSLWQFYGLVVFLDISTMWCAPCQELGEVTEETWQEYREQGFVYLTVIAEDARNGPTDPADLQAWANAYGITAPVVADDPNEDVRYANMAVEGDEFPTTVVIGRDMKVYDRVDPNDAAVRAGIEGALAE